MQSFFFYANVKFKKKEDLQDYNTKNKRIQYAYSSNV